MLYAYDWQDGRSCAYLHEFGVSAFCFEFLRRNAEYCADWQAAADTGMAVARRWGLHTNHAVDPSVGAERARIVWLPHLDPATLIVGPAPDGFVGARTIGDVTLALSRLTENGVPGPFARRGDGLPVALIGGAGADRPAAVVIPVDENFLMRIGAADWLFRTMAGHSPARPPAALTLPQRRRLALMLRGLDGRLAGYSYREIAIRLFAPRFIPAGREWKTSALRAVTIRLCSRGQDLMEGGYLDLLRHPRDFRA